jgi:hypothetical protein
MESVLATNHLNDEIEVEKLDYAYIETCSDVRELESIVQVLKCVRCRDGVASWHRSGKEGIYPHLEQFALDRLYTLCPGKRMYAPDCLMERNVQSRKHGAKCVRDANAPGRFAGEP